MCDGDRKINALLRIFDGACARNETATISRYGYICVMERLCKDECKLTAVVTTQVERSCNEAVLATKSIDMRDLISMSTEIAKSSEKEVCDYHTMRNKAHLSDSSLAHILAGLGTLGHVLPRTAEKNTRLASLLQTDEEMRVKLNSLLVKDATRAAPLLRANSFRQAACKHFSLRSQQYVLRAYCYMTRVHLKLATIRFKKDICELFRLAGMLAEIIQEKAV